ncbi:MULTISPECIES: sugar ABC transporter permease [unclassified Streptomyces]|uniref:carbohydrate ABC transporter permease n=1 Tax=unclassified Streptomyces TaxID=2593676 RepID=UPI002E801C2B|nr:sugar ABC transporter permease [Streptomyces sp. NBC_00589]WTI41570.1 sugar ABC transporter permease [Streptomyces sp. NBC_00775]WUB24747.1 sugar ABC transporter permease [Streptomyces sp. NBC_00589]
MKSLEKPTRPSRTRGLVEQRDRLSQESGPPGRPGPRRRARRTLYHYLFALPSIVLVLVFFAVPFVANGVFAFLQWTGYSDTIRWTGLTNFRLLDELGTLSHAIRVTVIYAAVSMVVQNAVSLALATALQQTNRVNTVFRSLFFIPVLISPLAAGYIWAAALSPRGPVNAFLTAVLPGSHHYAWLGHDTSALVAVASVDAWKWTGLVTLVYIAGLNRIPRSVIEAATLDGAGVWRRFRSVKFPLLAPSFTFNVVVTLVGSFSALDVVFSTTGGGPGDATTVLNVAVYNQYGQGFFGTASALGFVITLMVIVTAVPLIGWLRRREVQL